MTPAGFLKTPEAITEVVSQVVVLIAPADCISILSTVMAPLPSGLPAAFVVLVHGLTEQDRPLEGNLNRMRFPVEMARPHTQLRNGHAVILQSDGPPYTGHFDQVTMELTPGLSDYGTVLKSILTRFGSNTIAVILTSLDPDETEALKLMRSWGGHTIALDQSDRVWLNEHAPTVVVESQDTLLTAESIGLVIERIVNARRSKMNEEEGVPESRGRQLSELAPEGPEAPADSPRAGDDASGLARAQDDGWHPTEGQAEGQSPKLVASAWRALEDPYEFPHEGQLRTAAAEEGLEVTNSVHSEDGGFRHELVVETPPDELTE
jgi:hypothetical protein